MTTASRPVPAARGTRSRVAAVDGLRGLALLGMLAWHADLVWVRGGFARMTIFFVLSGYLATASLLRLRERSERGSTVLFLRRRMRRLLPVTVVGVAAAVAVTVAVGSTAARQSVGGDVLSVLTGWSNWRFIAESRSYGAMFESPSAVQHFWSLSAEEQCIWLLPVLLGFALWARRRSWALAAGGSVLLLTIPVWLSQSPDAVYYGTPNRAGEFLAGAALALWLHGPAAADAVRRRPRTVGLVGAASLATLLLVMLLVDRETAWLYRGGSALVVIPVLGVLLAALHTSGVAARVLAVAPLRTLGRWALSIYVIHWPLYLLVDGGLALDGAWLTVVQIGLAILVGGLLHVTVERPLLPMATTPSGPSAPSAPRLSVRRDRVMFPVLAGAAAALVAIALLVPTPPPVYDFEAAQARANQQPRTTTTSTSSASSASDFAGDTSGVGSGPPVLNIGVFGGSTGVLLGAAAFDWTSEVPDVQAVPAWSRYGCGFITNGEYLGRGQGGVIERNRPDPACQGWERNWIDAAQANRVQVALIVTGVWETTDWILDGKEAPSAIVDPDFDDVVRAQIGQALDELNAVGTQVIVATAPNIGPGTTGHARAERGLPDDHPRRVATYNRILNELAAVRDGVSVIDYGAYVDTFDGTRSVEWLPDGIHPTDEAARRIWSEFLGPQVHDTVQRTWPQLLWPDGPCCDSALPSAAPG